MRRSKVVCIFFAGFSISVAVANCIYEGLLRDVDAVSHWAVDAFWELAIRITGLGGSSSAEGESDDRAGVHVENLKLV
jgi:hypothetical protein